MGFVVRLDVGLKLGHYEIIAPVGAGGMGEVYRARDIRLGREVAIKILPEALARDADRIARFEREARLLAALNHPNIALIHGFEQCHGLQFLVMEFVSGPTLGQRLAEGPLEVEDALRIAVQVAEALEAAHEKGIIHRDLKPTNIKITPEGRVKVLDFGLAKVFVEEFPAADPSQSPTLTATATRAGVVLGTAAYMSPEQARGKPTDKRTDIWAFACVLYELLARRRAFEGADVSDTLAAVLRSEPNWSALPSGMPAGIRVLLARCLEKEPARRLRDIGDAQLEIEEILARFLRPAPAGRATALDAATVPSRKREMLAWALAVLFCVAGLWLAAVAYQRPGAVEAQRFQFTISPPENSTFSGISLSPDGRHLAFVADAASKRLLYVRPLGSVVAQPLAGTDDASAPFWSPDNRFLAFFAGGKLKKVAVSGGSPQTLAEADAPGWGGAWTREGEIVFSPGWGRPLQRIPEAGGLAVPITRLESSGQAAAGHWWPSFLPDGRHFLFFRSISTLHTNNATYVGSIDSDQVARVLVTDSNTVYAEAPGGGYLLYMREGALLAQPFDPRALKTIGEPLRLAESVGLGWINAFASFSVSQNGVLAYCDLNPERQLTWFDRSGKRLGLLGPLAASIEMPVLSPDGKRVAVQRRERNRTTADIWVYDLARGTGSRVTTGLRMSAYPVWSPDGSRIAFDANPEGSEDLYMQRLDGIGNPELLFRSPELHKHTGDWSVDGQFLLFHMGGLWVLPMRGGRKPFMWRKVGDTGQFAPDGKWIAYESTESGGPEVYVRRFSDTAAGRKAQPVGSSDALQVSASGGVQPRWRRDGNEIFFLSPTGTLMTAQVRRSSGQWDISAAKPLFDTPLRSPAVNIHQYAVTSDGQRFLFLSPAEELTPRPITVVVNWSAELKRPPTQ